MSGVSDQELRSLVRDAIARHTGRTTGPQPGTLALSVSKGPAPFGAAHASHGRFVLLAPAEDGQCVIEPAVRCNHCGYCQSYGH